MRTLIALTVCGLLSAGCVSSHYDDDYANISRIPAGHYEAMSCRDLLFAQSDLAAKLASVTDELSEDSDDGGTGAVFVALPNVPFYGGAGASVDSHADHSRAAQYRGELIHVQNVMRSKDCPRSASD